MVRMAGAVPGGHSVMDLSAVTLLASSISGYKMKMKFF